MSWRHAAASGLFTLATVGLFAYRSRAQQLRHRLEEEAARNFAESQVEDATKCYMISSTESLLLLISSAVCVISFDAPAAELAGTRLLSIVSSIR